MVCCPLPTLALQSPAPAVLIALSDAQTDPELSKHAQRAANYIRTILNPELVVVFGIPTWDIEGWFVAALNTSPHHTQATHELSFDPLQKPHKLTAQPNHAITDAKRVLRFLLGEGGKSIAETRTGALSCTEYEDLASTWDTQDLQRLGQFTDCGLSAFVTELQNRLAPKIIPGP